MFNFGSTDTESQSAERPMGCSMRVSAYQSYTGNGYTNLRTDNMNNTLPLVSKSIKRNTEFVTVINQCLHLNPAKLTAGINAAGKSGNIVIHGCPGSVRSANLSVIIFKTGKSLRTGYFVEQMSVDVKNRSFPLILGYDVSIIELFV